VADTSKGNQILTSDNTNKSNLWISKDKYFIIFTKKNDALEYLGIGNYMPQVASEYEDFSSVYLDFSEYRLMEEKSVPHLVYEPKNALIVLQSENYDSLTGTLYEVLFGEKIGWLVIANGLFEQCFEQISG
jgi:hypothetical protein